MHSVQDPHANTLPLRAVIADAHQIESCVASNPGAQVGQHVTDIKL